MTDMLQELVNLFANTYSPDPNCQKAGELGILEISGQEGMISAILQIMESDSVDLATRQACSVYLKNRVHTSYAVEPSRLPVRPEQIPILPSDRDALKASILRLLAVSPSRAITVQLAATLKDLVAHDFPERWPGLLACVRALLASGTIHDVAAGCVAALECVRAFRYRQRRDMLPDIVETLFPTLATIASNMLQHPFSAPEIPAMLHFILKTYRTSILMSLTPHQQTTDSLLPWGQLFFQVIDLHLPPEALPADDDERERCEWWKAKKWAFATLGRLFQRYGNPSQLPSAMKKEYAEFSQSFVNVLAPKIFDKYCSRELWTTGETRLSNKCMYHVISFFTECIKPKSTWVLLKPKIKDMIEHLIFPHLCFTSAMEELWQSDPVEYVRLSVDDYENLTSPVPASKTFITSLASNRTRTVFVPMIAIIRSAQTNPDPKVKFGALTMGAVLGPFMTRHPDFKGAMDEFVTQSVLPQLVAEEGYLRCIACEVLHTVVANGMQWKSEENLQKLTEAVYNALNDTELPVQVHAALAITKIIEVQDSVRDSIGSHVENIIQKLLDLSNKTDLDILGSAMETMVERFQDKLLSVAIDLTASLCGYYMRLARESLAQLDKPVPLEVDAHSMMSEREDNKVYTAMGVAKTISTIISSIESAPEILAKVQEVVIPIIHFTLEHKLIDLFDDMYSLVDSLTFETKAISASMWSVFELTYALFKTDAVDFFDEMLPCLDNFLSYGADVFKAHPEYCKMAFDIYETAMKTPQLGENDRVNGCKLAESMLLNLQGCIDDLLQPMIQIALNHMGKGNTFAFKLANLEVLVNALYYNATAALHLMERCEAGASRAFFDEWFATIKVENKLPTVHDKKLTIMALCRLLEVDLSYVPAVLGDGWASLVGGALDVFRGLPQAIAKRKALEESLVEDEESEDGEHSRVLNLDGGEDDDVWDEDSAYIEMLANEGARLRKLSEKPAGGGGSVDSDDDDEESEESEESEMEEDLGFLSKFDMDKVDPYVCFRQVLTRLQNEGPALYQAATTMLSAEQQTVLMEVMKTAEAQSAAAGADVAKAGQGGTPPCSSAQMTGSALRP